MLQEESYPKKPGNKETKKEGKKAGARDQHNGTLKEEKTKKSKEAQYLGFKEQLQFKNLQLCFCYIWFYFHKFNMDFTVFEDRI